MNVLTMTLGEFLFTRLQQVGCRQVIGVPGDFNLPLLDEIKRVKGITYTGACNELNAAYIADGNARIEGISALFTTQGVGELSAINGVAGAYAEFVPLVCIVGIPPLHSIRARRATHHTLGDGEYNNMLRCYQEFTVAQTRLTLQNAVQEIDRVLLTCIRQKQPVYIQIPSDIQHLKINTPTEPLLITPPVIADDRAFNAALKIVAERLNTAKQPAILFDRAVYRYQLGNVLRRLIDKTQIPYASLHGGKCALSESTALSLGVYSGVSSVAITRDYIESADCILGVAPLFDDLNSSLFSQRITDKQLISVYPDHVVIDEKSYEGIDIKQFLAGLMNVVTGKSIREKPIISPDLSLVTPVKENNLTQNYLWRRLRSFFKEGDVIGMDNGAFSGALEQIKMPKGVTYMSQPLWASIGYSLPAMLGSLLANSSRRHLLFIGDGAFQLTAQELSTIIRHEYKPIIFLINNEGYTIERYINGKTADYNDIMNWNYTKLPAVFGRDKHIADTYVVNDELGLEEALGLAESSDKIVFIELMLDRLDAPKGMESGGRELACFNYGDYGPHS